MRFTFRGTQREGNVQCSGGGGSSWQQDRSSTATNRGTPWLQQRPSPGGLKMRQLLKVRRTSSRNS